MLSVLITPAAGPAELAALLARLVPASVDGLVRDVLLAGTAEGVALELCEEAGVVVAGGRGEAERGAKCEWLLVLPQDFTLPDGWMQLAVQAAQGQGGVIAEARGGFFGLGRRTARLVRRG